MSRRESIPLIGLALVLATSSLAIQSLRQDVRRYNAELVRMTEAYEQAEAGRQELGAALYALMGAYNERVPACQEDQVLVGAGDFNGGRWERYECGPAVDDYEGSRQ